MRFDVALILNAPDGKQLIEMNLTRAGDDESLSLEAAVGCDYHKTVRVEIWLRCEGHIGAGGVPG